MVKNDALLSMHYLTLATLFDHVVYVYNCEMFCFDSYDARASQICVNFTRDTFLVSREKKLAKSLDFHETTMYECSMFQMRMMACISLFVNSVLI